MLRVYDGLVFESRELPDTYTVRVHELGNGHRECSISPVVVWSELCELHPDSIKGQLASGARTDDPDQAEREKARALASARRAKTRVRRLCKVMGLDTMLTLTYRALQLDLAACKRHVELFRKRMGRLLAAHGGTFDYVLTYERQARGAWHVHIATHRIPACFQRGVALVKSYDAIRAVWRAVVGELGGNVDISRRCARRSPAKLAAYLSKYITKAGDLVAPGDRRFQASAAEVPKASVIEVVAGSMVELIELAYAFAGDGHCRIETSFVAGHGKRFFLASSPGT